MQIIPLTNQPNQSFSITLNGQDCSINLYQKSTGLFCDLFLGTTQILQTQICLDRVYLVRYNYLGFSGNIAFIDTQGDTVPYYTGFNTRYLMAYSLPSEVTALV